MTDHALTPHSPRPPLRARSLTDLVELVPYLLGFHPRDSLVLVALRGSRRRVGVTMRVDLPEARQGVTDLPASLAAYLRRDGVGEVLVLVFGDTDEVGGDRPDGLPDAPLVQAFAAGLAESGLRIVDALYVGVQRWWSYACAEPGCCPVEGRAIPGTQGQTSPAVAAATYAGLVALPSRQALEQTLEPSDQVSARLLRRAQAELAGLVGLAETPSGPGPGPESGSGPGSQSGVEPGPDRPGEPPDPGSGTRSSWRRKVVGEIAEVLSDQVSRGYRRLPDEQVARFLVAIRDNVVRDLCCDWVEGDKAEAALALWRQLATRAVPPYQVTPLALVAWSAWHTGSGPLARIAVDRALAADPGCRLALLLDEALDRGVNPATVRGRPRGRRRRTRASAGTGRSGGGTPGTSGPGHGGPGHGGPGRGCRGGRRDGAGQEDQTGRDGHEGGGR